MDYISGAADVWLVTYLAYFCRSWSRCK